LGIRKAICRSPESLPLKFVPGGKRDEIRVAGGNFPSMTSDSTILAFWPVLLHGVIVTLEVTAASACVASFLAIVVGTAGVSRVPVLRAVAKTYTEILRGTSALIQLFYLYFILPVLGIDTTPMVAAALGLGLTFSAYGAEIVRSGILGVDPGQWDAARALGMPRSLAFRRIILPQAFASMLAPFGNLLVELLKSTSLVSLIALTDLTFSGAQVITSTGKPGQTWGAVLLLYFLMCFPLAQAVRSLEKRFTLYRGPQRRMA
jgi:polar amino acid transport system permease protein